ncbi:Protein translocase subunit secFprotein translocase subunit secD [uncultured Paludibacter sp.]|nr:Protein translocase subunit secFprotein translocase subunit secD [uncultured Paludibacter sp.]
MQNKGLVRLFAIALTLVCIFYLSFSVVTSIYESKAKAVAQKAVDNFKKSSNFATLSTIDKNNALASVQEKAYYNYLDSISTEKVFLSYTLRQVREKQLGLGLDLKGGMNVVMEISEPDILRALSDNNPNPNFNKALANASELQKTNSGTPYLDLFIQSYKKIDPNVQLSTIFSTLELKDRISLSTSNDDVKKVLRKEIDGAISNSFNVLRTRIDRFGVVQPDIQKLEGTGRILISLPGVKEPERVRKLLQGSANLEFWETYDFSEIYNNIAQANTILSNLNASEQVQTADTVKTTAETVKSETEKTAPTTSVDSLKAALQNKNLTNKTTAIDSLKQVEKFRKENPLLSIIALNTDRSGQIGRGPVIGYVQAKDTAIVNSYFKMKQVQEVLPPNLGLRWSVKPLDEKSQMYELIAIKYSNREKRAPLAGNVITDARDDFGQNSAYAEVSMSMNAEGAKTWARMTKDNIGKSIAIALDGYIYSYPTVQNEISGGQSNITGRFTTEEAKDLANVLKSGKMPAPAHIVQEDVVGPSLGKEAIHSGLISFIIAFIVIILYMVIYYGFIPGIIADLAMFANVFFLVGILASLSSVLTLPGIAGIVLTMGMAVDANVLIYERIREEMRGGMNMRKAIQEGFRHALNAIVDSNVTTFLTGIILTIFGQGPIKGFGVTLSIGIITTFITAVFLTRYMIEAYARRENAKDLPFHTKLSEHWLQNTNFDFMKIRRKMFILSGLLFLISFISFGVRGFSLGNDFTGGRYYVISFDQAVKTDNIRTMLKDAFDGDMPQVITIGNESQVRIATKYKINDNSATTDNEIETKLYENLKPLLKQNVTRDQFVKDNIKSSSKVGPTVADEIKTSAIWAIVLAVLGIGLYILIRFREWGYALGAIISLIHDVVITLGVFSLLHGFLPFSMEIDQSFIAAILTVLGYSINDTVINYDRIRENVHLYPKRDRLTIINDSVNQMLGRTFSTTMTVFLVLLAMFIFGGETIRGFIFAMLFGIIIGVYSSVYIASPVTYEVNKLIARNKDKKKLVTSTVSKK